jgi:hypothetical protein
MSTSKGVVFVFLTGGQVWGDAVSLIFENLKIGF